MWPDQPKPAKSPAGSEAKADPRRDQSLREALAAPAKPPANDQRAAAILKSGVVDGMGYTLYVDGSIEAELPQGTLRFASINELRSHLEKNPIDKLARTNRRSPAGAAFLFMFGGEVPGSRSLAAPVAFHRYSRVFNNITAKTKV